MSFRRVVAFVVVEERDAKAAIGGFNRAMDDLVLENKSVFDSGINSSKVLDVPNAEEVRAEALGFRPEE